MWGLQRNTDSAGTNTFLISNTAVLYINICTIH